MSQTTSATTGRRYGLERVCRLWEQSRSAFYASVDGSNPAISGHRKAGHFRRPETAREFYFMGSRTRKDLSLVKPGPPGP